MNWGTVVGPIGLRKLYLECDGFRKGRGNAKYLFSLVDEDFIGSLVTITRHFWEEVAVPNLRPFVFYGSSSGDHCWGIRWEGTTMDRVREIAEALLHPD